jgi:hypothetical protein
MELNPENNSGSDVTAAIRIKPIQALPNPLKSAMISPYFDSLTPEKTIKIAQEIKPPKVSITGFNCIEDENDIVYEIVSNYDNLFVKPVLS